MKDLTRLIKSREFLYPLGQRMYLRQIALFPSNKLIMPTIKHKIRALLFEVVQAMLNLNYFSRVLR